MKSLVLFMSLIPVLLCFDAHGAIASDQQKTNIDCMMNTGPCIKSVDELTVAIDITPKPVKTMRTSLFRATISRNGRPVADASVTFNLSMPGMFMGQNIIMLNHLNEGIYEGNGVIIRCPSGKRIWQASVAINQDGRKSVVNYIFEVP